MRIRVLLVLLFMMECGGCSLLRPTVADPVDSLVRHGVWREPSCTRIERIVMDLNNDGLDDMAVAAGRINQGGKRLWNVYLKTGGGRYASAGRLRFDPSALRIEPVDRGTTRILVPGRPARSEYILSTRLRKSRARPRKGAAPVAADNLFSEQVECCLLTEYLKTRNCLWKRLRPADGTGAR
jgi:hypothetical protein